MIQLRKEDIFHKSQLNRLLIEIVDTPALAAALAFKGGTCAAMLGRLDRFSVDLDFDLVAPVDHAPLRDLLADIFTRLDMTLVKTFRQALFFELRYPTADPSQRHTLKVSFSDDPPHANDYKVEYLSEIDRMVRCQTAATMFANKLVAVTDRFARYQTLAGRDIYDIHHFFLQGYTYKPEIITERTGQSASDYLRSLTAHIRKYVTQRVIDEDLNTLLPPAQFRSIRKVILPETLHFLESPPA